MSSLGGLTVGELIPGDPGGLSDLGRQLTALGSGLGQAVSTLSQIDGGSWEGTAADAFRRTIKQQPGRYSAAAESFSTAGAAIQAFAQELADAQRQAAGAISEWESAQGLTSAWSAKEKQPTGADPGAEGRAVASAAAGRAQAEFEAAVGRLAAILGSEALNAPPGPSLLHRFIDDAEGVAKHVFSFEKDIVEFGVRGYVDELKFAWHFADGVVAGVAGMAKGVWDLGKAGFAVITDPTAFMRFSTEAALVVEGAVHHPVRFAETFGSIVFDVNDLEHDPAKWAGELVPAIALAAFTAGAGTAADGADAMSTAADAMDGLGKLETVQSYAQAADSAAHVDSNSDGSGGARDEAVGAVTQHLVGVPMPVVSVAP